MSAARLRVLSLFAGIGGLDLGLERAGMEVVGQCELDPFCQKVLEKHWPMVWRHSDVRTLTGAMAIGACGRIDMIAGGPPCQAASCAGKRKGAADERWMWGEWCRLVREVGPTWFLAENVRGWLTLPESRGVIRELEGAGYEVRCLLLGARHVGAPHRRDRIWIVGRLADAGGAPVREAASGWADGADGVAATGAGQGSGVAHPDRRGLRIDGGAGGRYGHADQQGARVADAPEVGRRAGSGEPGHETGAGPARGVRPGGRPAEHGGGARWPARPGEPQHGWEEPRLVDSHRSRERQHAGELRSTERGSVRGVLPMSDGTGRSQAGLPEPALGRATARLPGGLSRWRRAALQALGNAVVPQVAEVVGRAIMEAAMMP